MHLRSLAGHRRRAADHSLEGQSVALGIGEGVGASACQAPPVPGVGDAWEGAEWVVGSVMQGSVALGRLASASRIVCRDLA